MVEPKGSENNQGRSKAPAKPGEVNMSRINILTMSIKARGIGKKLQICQHFAIVTKNTNHNGGYDAHLQV